MHRHLSKEDIYAANKHMKKFSSLLVIREMQTKTILKYHLTPVRRTIVKNLETPDAGVDVEKQECFYTVGRSVNQFNHCGKLCGYSSRIQKQKYHLTQQCHYWAYNQRIINCSIIKTHAHKCSLQHCLQHQRLETNPNAHEWQAG